jgi:hypothetical protein
MSTTGPSLPPVVPKRSLAPVIAAVVAGLAVVGVLWWKLTGSAPESPPKVVAPAVVPRPVAAVAPEPPPPPPPEVEAAPSAIASRASPGSAATKPELTRAPVKRDPNCDDPCDGKETPALVSALGARAGQARSCYEKALSNNSTLAGRLEVGVRVSGTGAACSASIAKDALGDASVTSCLLERFRTGKYPPPIGGCVNVAVPMNFMPAGSR